MNAPATDPKGISKSNPLAISLPEIALIAGYFVAVWLLPSSWIETPMGAAALSLAATFNPYLSERSIAFAASPQDFIHAHVLATWIIAPGLFPLIVRRNGGRTCFGRGIAERVRAFGGLEIYVVANALFFGSLYFGMAWLVDYPLTSRGERAFWVTAVPWTALMTAGALSIGIGLCWLAIFPGSESSSRRIRAEGR